MSTHGGPDTVQVADVADPSPHGDQVLVRVHAAGLSFPEVLQSRGGYQYQPELPFVPGSEVAGTVISAPAGSGFGPGDRVAAFTLIGGLAELAVAPADSTFPLPESVSFTHGAALLLNYLTAHVALKHRGRLVPGETVLVHGAAGGVGTAAIQIARALGASRIVAVVSTDDKAAAAVEAGATECAHPETFREETSAGGKVDVVVDPVGGDRFVDSLRCLRPEGRILVVGFTSGEIPTVRVNRLLLNNIDVVGVAWGSFARTRPGFLAEQWAELMSHHAAGTVRPLVDTRYRLQHVTAALRAIEDRRVVGKMVVAP